MKNFTKKLSAIALCTVFATMQVTAADMTGNVGLGAGNNGATIIGSEGGFKGFTTGDKSATLNFESNAHVKWDSLNVNKGETLNFNAINGANGLTVVNTVQNNMSKISGTINTNDGISKLIISNPNGMLYDGANFNTAGDVMLTTQAVMVNFVQDGVTLTPMKDAEGNPIHAVGAVTVKDSNFSVGGEFKIIAPAIDIVRGKIATGKGLRLHTKNGADYLLCCPPEGDKFEYHSAVRMETVSIDGDVYVLSGRDIAKVVNGGEIRGNLNIDSDGTVAINYVDGNETTPGTFEKFHVTGDLTSESDARVAYLRNSKVDGKVTMSNSGGFLEVGNVNVGNDMNLTTTVKSNEGVKHFVHVIGDNTVGGNVNINSDANIHIGGYNFHNNDDPNFSQADMRGGSLKADGNITAVANDGTIYVSSDVTAKEVDLASKTLNIITDGKATITADKYSFDAAHYVGGVNISEKIIDTMENYKPIPVEHQSNYLNIAGGDVVKAKGDVVKIRANGDMNVTNVNANDVTLASGKDINIGPNVNAKTVTVDGETRNLTVENPANKRGYTLKYTNIKDTEVITVTPDTEITYEMANGDNGWNKGTQTAENTYLVVPGSPVTPPPVNPPVDPDPDVPPVNPPADPDPQDPTDGDAEKILRNLNKDQVASAIDAQQVYTPVAFAADLDEEIDTGVRKNVDGSVTVVRPYTPSK